MMVITKHNVPLKELEQLFTQTSGKADYCRLWVNQRGQQVYITADIDMGIITLNAFSDEFENRELAEAWLNKFDFDIDYDICGDEEE